MQQKADLPLGHRVRHAVASQPAKGLVVELLDRETSYTALSTFLQVGKVFWGKLEWKRTDQG